MYISEIFESVQGEGINIGVLSTFVRFSGCNLSCAWCDTKYASSKENGKYMTVDSVVDEIRKFHNNNIVLTGGEPLLQDGIMELIRELRQMKYFVEVETNGTIGYPDFQPLDNYFYQPNLWNVSLKLVSSGISKQGRIRKEVIRRFQRIDDERKNVVWKFVIQHEKDFKEAMKLVDEFRLRNVVFMPQTTRRSQVQDLIYIHDLMKERCLPENFRVLPRLHIIMYGNVRGK